MGSSIEGRRLHGRRTESSRDRVVALVPAHRQRHAQASVPDDRMAGAACIVGVGTRRRFWLAPTSGRVSRLRPHVRVESFGCLGRGVVRHVP